MSNFQDIQPGTTYRSIHAAFTSRSIADASSKGPSLIQSTSPIITSALSSAFPYLLMIDKLLAAITWTNEDSYQGFLLIVIYGAAVRYWDNLGSAIVPVAASMAFCCVSWTITTVSNESSDPPTLEEVVALLSNICTRCEILREPLKVLDSFTLVDFGKLLLSSVLLWPFYVFVLQRIYNTKWFSLIFGILALTYYSPWATASRCLLWRSSYVRTAAKAVTGLDVLLTSRHSKNPIATDHKVIYTSKTNDSEKQTVEFQIFENQRRWIGMGWSGHLLPNERAPFTNEKFAACSGFEGFHFPEMPEVTGKSFKWEWLDPKWQIDVSFNKGNDKEGWIYYDNYWDTPGFVDSISKYTRSRKWRRRATLVIEAKK
ncbi:unnamed protein product [Kuraishia capsulata CBS 1993]|uniref:Peroxin/Ferlin domain-containing protein n=1 Tax=Kuraishia capsulata CBS 1993 TaxID=1382522 RepID=W6MRT6_9ASCO|nr:uncharacterized protein KUCA_T00000490001 [Kuraishia capsulata CBS 1993]CDK24525.1 unnamed protein product [Kuraishia capsulata CBS 1993]